MNYKRILIVRTDRVGDVVLSTPVIKALRSVYPDSFIAMMVSPYTEGVVTANPYLNEVILFDKDLKHKSWLQSIKFSLWLKKKKFDLVIILHPTNRVHIVTFFSGIKRRIGYDRKFGFLLTDKIKHLKQEGTKHEIDYCLDMLKVLDIDSCDKKTFVAISDESLKYVEKLFKQEGISSEDVLLAINPGASCPSRIWPAERFAEVADRLVKEYNFKVLLIGGGKEAHLAQDVANHMKTSRPINLAGRVNLNQLAAILKRSRLLISNDSGPVHIAAALDIPVVSIFSRSQPGLSPKRWGPAGKKSVFLHKNVGCIECLAHNCIKGFACLKAITVEDVLNAGKILLKAV